MIELYLLALIYLPITLRPDDPNTELIFGLANSSIEVRGQFVKDTFEAAQEVDRLDMYPCEGICIGSVQMHLVQYVLA